jgi:hypothetical protein
MEADIVRTPEEAQGQTEECCGNFNSIQRIGQISMSREVAVPGCPRIRSCQQAESAGASGCTSGLTYSAWKILMQGDVDGRTSKGLLSEQKGVVCTHVRKQMLGDNSLDREGPRSPLFDESARAP